MSDMDRNNLINDENILTPIQRFYSGANVFITGATGFLGRILVEKLLRSCPELSTLYVLIRNKKGCNVHDRLDQLLDDVVFERLKNEQPKFRHKVVAVAGDCALPELGLNMQDRQMLMNEVNIIFHVAATVRFDEKLKLAVAINVKSVQEILRISRRMLNLKSIVYVSTGYSNCPQTSIGEQFYNPPLSSKKLVTLTEILNDSLLDQITPAILEKWPNTYTFTKAIAEDVISCEGKGLPVGVFRPAIVVSTYQEPLKGWINNLYGPTGVVAGAGTGLLHSLHCNPKVKANIVPVDMCVNALIASAWEVGETYAKCQNDTQPFEIPIYHFESNTDQPISWGFFMDKCAQYGLHTPTVKAIWYYCLTLQPTATGHMIAIFFMHIIPALLCDLVLICLGKGPKLFKAYKKIHKFSDVISYFSTKNFEFCSNRVQKMLTKMSEEDRRIFFCDLKKLNWEEFFTTYVVGIRVYLIGDPLDTLESAKIRWKRLYYLHQTLKLIVTFLLLKFLWWIFASILS